MADHRTGHRACMLLAARVQGIANEVSRLSDAQCEQIAQDAENLLTLFELLVVATRGDHRA